MNIPVLDHGFVNLVDHMGSDLTVVNAARVSFGKHKEVIDASDEKLIKYLITHGHTAPFRHAYMTFHVRAPIFVFRQWMKHRIASDFNEISGRYTEFQEEDFYLPQAFRKQAIVNKQGSEGEIEENIRLEAHQIFDSSCRDSISSYRRLLELGVCREQARCVLPVGMYSEAYWTVSLQAAAHFLHLRLDSHAQWEIQQYAGAVREIAATLFPISISALSS